MAISSQIQAQLYLRNARLSPNWIVIALAKICSFPDSHKPRKNIVVLVGKFLKKPEYPEMRRTFLTHTNKRRHRP